MNDIQKWASDSYEILHMNIHSNIQASYHKSFNKLLDMKDFFDLLGQFSLSLKHSLYQTGMLSDIKQDDVQLEYSFLFPRGRNDIGWHKDGPDLCICLMYLPQFNLEHSLIPTRLIKEDVFPSACRLTEYQIDPAFELPSDAQEIILPRMEFGDVLVINNRTLFHRHPKNSELYGNLLRVAVRKRCAE